MSAVTEKSVDTARANGQRAGAGLAGQPASAPPADRRQVMDTLLGANRLAAVDVSGGDPYNATGRLFRR